MKTQQEAVAWAKSKVGGPRIGDGQCVPFVRAYIDFLGYPQPPLVPGAKDLWPLNWGPDFTKISVGLPSRPGDIPIWNSNVGGGFGHISVEVAPKLARFDSVDQNWNNVVPGPGDPPALINHDKSNVLGFVRPKFKEDDVTSRTTAIWLLRTLTHKHSPEEKDIKGWTGLTDEQLAAKLERVYGADWFKAQTAKIKAPVEFIPVVEQLFKKGT